MSTQGQLLVPSCICLDYVDWLVSWKELSPLVAQLPFEVQRQLHLEVVNVKVYLLCTDIFLVHE